jgi:hypothetical protein
VTREATGEDARAVLDHVEHVSGESDFLAFGPGEFEPLVGWARATRIVTKRGLRLRADHRRATGLYTRKGFVHEGTTRKAVRVRGAYFDLECMGRDL